MWCKNQVFKTNHRFFSLSQKNTYFPAVVGDYLLLSVWQNQWQEVADVGCQIPWCLKYKASKYKVSKYKSKYKIQDKEEANIQKANKYKDFAFQQKRA